MATKDTKLLFKMIKIILKSSLWKKWKCSSLSHVWLYVTLWTVSHQAPLSIGFSRQQYWSGCHSLLQGVFLTQGSKLCLLWSWIAGRLYPLSHQKEDKNYYLKSVFIILSIKTKLQQNPNQKKKKKTNEGNSNYDLNVQYQYLCLVARLCLTLCDSLDCSPPGSLVHGDSPDKNTRVGCHVLLQGIFPTQGSNPDFPHYYLIVS